jgi:anion-transporting  ArsA/GET3 family ATPase
MGIFYHLLTWLREDWQTIVVDMPATGHALGMTSLPDLGLGVLPRGPIAEALREGQAHLNQPSLCTSVIVTLPEQLPVTEALELAEGLQRTKVHVSGFAVNRVPQNPFNPKEREWIRDLLKTRRPFGAEAFERFDEIEISIARLLVASARAEREVVLISEQGSVNAPLGVSLIQALASSWEAGGMAMPQALAAGTRGESREQGAP